MTISAGVGSSKDRNPAVAGKEAVQAAMAAAGLEQPDFVLFFATVGYDQERLVAAAHQAAGAATLIGCSGEGVIVGSEADEGNFAATALAVTSSTLKVRSGLCAGLGEECGARRRGLDGVVDAIGAALDETPDPLGLLLFPDALTVDFDRLLLSIQERCSGVRLPILGGLAGDNWSLERTYQYGGGEVVSDGVAWALLSGSAKLVWSRARSCVPIGTRRIVTRSEGNAIFEIDGIPVQEVLGEYLAGDQREDWPTPLVNIAFGFEAPEAFRAAGEDCDFVVTHLAPSDEDAARGCISLPRQIPEGTPIWLMRRDAEEIAASLDRMASRLTERFQGAVPAFVLDVDCSSRGKSMFRREERKTLRERLRARVAPGVPWLGFYSYGEICPVAGINAGHCYADVVMAVLP